jgi:hypothetical protein
MPWLILIVVMACFPATATLFMALVGFMLIGMVCDATRS